VVDLTQYLWIIWLVFVIVCVIIEVVTLEFTFLMIAAGSLLGGLGLNLLGADWWVQIAAAAVLSALLLFTIRPLLLTTLQKGADPAKSNVDALYGMRARVTLAVTELGGQVKLANGETWTARLAPAGEPTNGEPTNGEPTNFAEGDRVVVTRVDGATVEVAPEERNDSS
jgi:membrane protein implicated in regulation of membrane protease activity